MYLQSSVHQTKREPCALTLYREVILCSACLWQLCILKKLELLLNNLFYSGHSSGNYPVTYVVFMSDDLKQSCFVCRHLGIWNIFKRLLSACKSLCKEFILNVSFAWFSSSLLTPFLLDCSLWHGRTTHRNHSWPNQTWIWNWDLFGTSSNSVQRNNPKCCPSDR